ncbi:hypothetical protein [Granulicella sibirica]|uniref:Uncharacterized protein n=1 Tax=Granulicella sibirica TaxID=2479048 RepID=A0A4Q0SVL6_9BACT|nr:hypothetical protein [Granulicella sibirica]RXH54837.1 hypothetical protein GRAN_3941 [Granulicella sibirica]
MGPILKSLLIAALHVPLLTIQDAQSPPKASRLISIGETRFDFLYGVMLNSCMVVRTDGRFHLETRLQKLPNTFSTPHVYEATFDSFQMTRLQSLLGAQDLLNAPSFQLPRLPVTVPRFAVFQLERQKSDEMRTNGYVAWDERTGHETESPDASPPTLKQQWQQSRAALNPMESWFHEVQSLKWPEIKATDTGHCVD